MLPLAAAVLRHADATRFHAAALPPCLRHHATRLPSHAYHGRRRHALIAAA